MITSSKPAENGLPPRVKGLPILGNTLEALNDVVGLLVKANHDLGPVFRITRFGKQVYILAGLKANRFFIEHEDEFLTTGGVYDHSLNEGGSHHTFIALEGDEHNHLRRQMQHGFSRQQIAAQVPALIRYVQQVAVRWQPGHVFDALSTMSEVLVEQAGTSMLNYSLTPKAADQIGEFCKTFIGVGAGIQPAFLLKRPAYQRGKRLFIDNMASVYAAHQAHPAGTTRAFDLMDAAMETTYLNGGKLKPEDAIGNSFYPYVMNSVYTNRTTSYLLYELLKNPDAMERVMAEVESILRQGGFKPHHAATHAHPAGGHQRSAETLPDLCGHPSKCPEDVSI